MFDFLFSDGVSKNWVSTAVLIVLALIIRWGALRAVRRAGLPTSDIRRSWIVQIQNLTISVGAGEIQEFAFSLAAAAVALVIGTKELIMCFLGGVLKMGSRAFRIGDRIEVNGLRGDVVDMNFFTTTVFEIGPGHILHQYTGRKLVIHAGCAAFVAICLEKRFGRNHPVVEGFAADTERGFRTLVGSGAIAINGD